jgi:peptidase MA superfamily protein
MQSTATYQFGEQITFVAQIQSLVQIQQANIVIFDEAQAVTHVQPVEFINGTSEYHFDVRQNLVSPFSLIRWYYELTLTDGSVIQSDSYSIRYDDNRFAWQKLESGSLRVMWLQGDAAFGQSALNAAQTGLQIINGIVPVDLTQPIDIFIYPSQNDLAALGVETWAVGHANPALSAVLVVIEPDASQSLSMEQRIPHELMHVMLYRQIGEGFSQLPSWLNEGIATLAEINPNADYDRVLLDASNRGALIPLADLCASFPADSAQAFLAYAEARSFTTYLRDTYGAPALLNLAQVYTEGVDCDNGAQRALGTSLSQLELAWRENSLGQNVWGVAFRKLLPYLVLLGLLIFIPLILGLTTIRQKADKHEPEKYTNQR